jgi:hypothetical protein
MHLWCKYLQHPSIGHLLLLRLLLLPQEPMDHTDQWYRYCHRNYICFVYCTRVYVYVYVYVYVCAPQVYQHVLMCRTLTRDVSLSIPTNDCMNLGIQ